MTDGDIVTERGSVAKSVRLDVFSGVCLFVCQHDNFHTSKHTMMKLGCRWLGALYKNLANFWGRSPLGAHDPQKCGVRLRRWENQRRLSSLTF